MLAASLSGGAARADDTVPPPPPEDYTVTYEAGADVYDTQGKFKYSKVYDQATIGTEVGADDDQVTAKDSGGPQRGSRSGTGGSSSASGCKRAWAQVTYRSYTGSILWQFKNVTRWCWNRADKRIYNVDTWWRLPKVASNVEWQGIVNSRQHFYQWIDGYGRSGHDNYRMGQFKNCPFAFIPCDYYYPAARVRAHSNGTFYWWGSW